MDYLTLQQYRYQTRRTFQIYKIGYYNKDSVNIITEKIIIPYAPLNNSKDAIISAQINENKIWSKNQTNQQRTKKRKKQ